jgi:large subunit ribosomal protein L32
VSQTLASRPETILENCGTGAIMAVPKRRTSRSKQGKRRSHHHATPIQVNYCPHCGEPVLSHRVCPNCGKYRDRTIISGKEEEENK